MNIDTECKNSDKNIRNGYKCIRFPLLEEEYERVLSDNKYFIERLNFNIEHCPDLSPDAIKNGYRLYGFITVITCKFFERIFNFYIIENKLINKKQHSCEIFVATKRLL